MVAIEGQAQQARAIRMVLDMFVDAVKEAGPLGVPGGTLYAAVLDKMSLANFETIMDVLVETGRLVKRGQLYIHPECRT